MPLQLKYEIRTNFTCWIEKIINGDKMCIICIVNLALKQGKQNDEIFLKSEIFDHANDKNKVLRNES